MLDYRILFDTVVLTDILSRSVAALVNLYFVCLSSAVIYCFVYSLQTIVFLKSVKPFMQDLIKAATRPALQGSYSFELSKFHDFP